MTEAARALAGRVATEGITTAERAAAQARKQYGLLSFGHENRRHHRSSAAGQTLGVPEGPARDPARAMASPLSSMENVAQANERSGWPSSQRPGTALGRGGTRQRRPRAANPRGRRAICGEGQGRPTPSCSTPLAPQRRPGEAGAAKAGGELGEAKRLSWGRLKHNTAGWIRRVGQGIKWNPRGRAIGAEEIVSP